MLSREYLVFQYMHIENESDEEPSQQEKIERELRQLVQQKYGLMAEPVIVALNWIKDLYHKQVQHGLPSALHPLRVAWMQLELDQYVSSKVCIAALLHDALHEDLIASQEIEQRFGAYVLKLVQSMGISFCCTGYLNEDHSNKQRQWQAIMRGSHEVRSLRVFDDLDNILAWRVMPAGHPAQAYIAHWWEDVCEMSVPLAHATNMHAYNIIRQEYEQWLK